jgi:alkylation response protein AidB-like acyl-CoA dehydrogenase
VLTACEYLFSLRLDAANDNQGIAIRMNDSVQSPLTFHTPVTPHSDALTALLAAIEAGASEREQQRRLPYDIIDLVRQSRLGALRIRTAQGGPGASARALFEVVIRLGEADPNVAHILRNHFSLVERFVRNHPGGKHAKWLRAVLDGAIIGLAFGELETKQVGNREVRTTLTPGGQGFRLNGTKYYSTGSLFADYILVRAVTPDGESVSAIIPADREGVELIDDWDGFGQRLTGSGTTVLHNVRVDANEAVFDTEGPFYTQPYTGTVPQLILTAVNAGILRAILRDATALIHRRQRSFYHATAERPVDDPTLQQTIGQIASNAFAAEATVLAAADALDQLDAVRDRNEPDEAGALEASLRASKAKVVVDELTIRSASLLFDVGGASATKHDYNLDRHWRNARTLASHNPGTYKARAIGDHVINGTPLPASGFF